MVAVVICAAVCISKSLDGVVTQVVWIRGKVCIDEMPNGRNRFALISFGANAKDAMKHESWAHRKIEQSQFADWFGMSWLWPKLS